MADGKLTPIQRKILEILSDLEPPFVLSGGGAPEPVQARIGGVPIWVATAHEVLVDKLCTLLSRSEIRDLYDVRMLLDRGGDLERALEEAPKKDAGFSPLTLAWTLKSFPVRSLGEASGWSQEKVAEIETFRQELVGRLLDDTSMAR